MPTAGLTSPALQTETAQESKNGAMKNSSLLLRDDRDLHSRLWYPSDHLPQNQIFSPVLGWGIRRNPRSSDVSSSCSVATAEFMAAT